MAKAKTSKEIHDDCRRILGAEFGDIYFHAKSEWIDIWVTWNQYENLFGQGPERVELMNKAGAIFFYMVQRHFFETVLLGVCRLSDPIKTGRKTNLTVLALHQFMDTDERRTKLESLLDEVGTTTEFARDWRNRRISHNDLDLKNGTADPLESANRDLVNTSLKSIHNVLSYISLEFMDSELMGEVAVGFNNEITMLDRLYLGIEANDRELNELKNNKIVPLERPEWLHN